MYLRILGRVPFWISSYRFLYLFLCTFKFNTNEYLYKVIKVNFNFVPKNVATNGLYEWWIILSFFGASRGDTIQLFTLWYCFLFCAFIAVRFQCQSRVFKIFCRCIHSDDQRGWRRWSATASWILSSPWISHGILILENFS